MFVVSARHLPQPKPLFRKSEEAQHNIGEWVLHKLDIFQRPPRAPGYTIRFVTHIDIVSTDIDFGMMNSCESGPDNIQPFNFLTLRGCFLLLWFITGV